MQDIMSFAGQALNNANAERNPGPDHPGPSAQQIIILQNECLNRVRNTIFHIRFSDKLAYSLD